MIYYKMLYTSQYPILINRHYYTIPLKKLLLYKFPCCQDVLNEIYDLFIDVTQCNVEDLIMDQFKILDDQPLADIYFKNLDIKSKQLLYFSTIYDLRKGLLYHNKIFHADVILDDAITDGHLQLKDIIHYCQFIIYVHYNNVAVGYNALINNQVGSQNTAIGSNALVGAIQYRYF